MGREYNAAIVLSGGSGTRMGAEIPKQYLKLGEEPILSYSLMAMERCPRVDEVILVADPAWQDYCRQEIVTRLGLSKVSRIVSGGKERYDSVYAGLKALDGCDYVFIHDGARPFLDQEILERNLEAARETGAAVTGMPSKDTVKIADAQGYVAQTPGRDRVWIIQTPQTFAFALIREAYERLMETDCRGITDDAMVAERMCGAKVRLVEGSWRNLKITTPEDLAAARAMLEVTIHGLTDRR